ncbi:MAG: hypothetical protein WCO84_09625, partial [bacterium]
RRLSRDDQHADLSRAVTVSATTKFFAELRDADHTDLVSVFVPEKGQCAFFFCIFQTFRFFLDRTILQDLIIGRLLDRTEFIKGYRAAE